jgi:hypothetical protein
VGDSKSSTMYDLAKNNIVGGSIISNKLDLLGQVQQQHIQTMSVENLELGEITRNCT